MGDKFKKPKSEINSGKFEIKAGHVEMLHFDYPIFCFKNLHPDYSISKCDEKEKASLMDAIHKRSQLTWNALKLLDRHKLGSEKIKVSSLKAKLPSSVTDDVTELLAFRYHDMKPFLGYQYKFIFHVLFIDYKRDLYDHT